MALAALILLPLLASLSCALAPRAWRTPVAWTAGVFALATLGVLALSAPAVFAGEVLRAGTPWLPVAGVGFTLRLDGLGFLFALLVAGIGALVLLYSAYYLNPEDSAPRLFGLLSLFMAAMLGVVLAGDLVTLVVFWEVTSLASFLLVGYWNRRAEARQGARMALVVTGAGGLCLLAAAVLVGQVAGSFDLDAVLDAGDVLRGHPWYPLVLALFLLAAFTKSAQFPFHFWLPHAMAAPTPVSALLHSATLVKAGVFLLARFHPLLSGTEAWFWSVSTVGLATLLLGAWFALHQHDLKGLLAYSTVSHLGLITLLFGLDTRVAVVAGVFHIFNHALFKASLFMAVGIIDHECGTRDLRRVNGMFRYLPITSLLAMTAAAAMAGVPLLNGFLSKEMFFAESLALESHGLLRWTTPLAATLAGLFSVAYSARFIHDTFFHGAPVDLPRMPHEPVIWMRLPVALLVLACLAVGLLPTHTVGPLLAVAAGAALGGPLPHYSLALWHGFTAPLAMSVAAFAGGLALYFRLQRGRALHRHAPRLTSGKHRYDRLQERLVEGARLVILWSHNGSLQRYLFLLLLTAVALASAMLALHGLPLPAVLPPPGAAVLLWGIGVACAVAVAIAYRFRLVAVLLLGAVGLVVALAFAWLSAPDLALTQLLVELTSLLLMLMALRHLPRTAPVESAGRLHGRTARHLAIAAGCGVGMTLLTLAMLGLPRPVPGIAPFFLDNAKCVAGGNNVVNVILVDFRAFDTLGEITVLAIAALTVFALLYGYRARVPHAENVAFPLLARVAPVLLPLAGAVSLFLLLRGHDLPGGGFIAGLVLAVALSLQAMALGLGSLAPVLRPVLHPLLAAGLTLAVATGAGALVFAHPFLTSTFAHPALPLVGEVPLASALLFDLGVWLVVGAALLLVLTGLGRAGGRR